jgi:hypothetical protein
MDDKTLFDTDYNELKWFNGKLLGLDNQIVNYLIEAKEKGDPILQYFQIGYPLEDIKFDTNSIFVSSLESELLEQTHNSGYYRDTVEIVISSDIQEYEKGSEVIKAGYMAVFNVLIQHYEDFDNIEIEDINLLKKDQFAVLAGLAHVRSNTNVKYLIPEQYFKYIKLNVFEAIEDTEMKPQKVFPDSKD